MHGSKLKEPTFVTLPNGDKRYSCGCVTFWGSNGGDPTVLFRNACASHRGYVQKCGALVDPNAER